MLNYIRAEFYKLSRRKYPYATLITLLSGAALLVAGYVFTNAHGAHVYISDGAVMPAVMMSMGLYLSLLMGDMVFSNQYKNNTLKNEVAFGLPRARIYFGKLAVEAAVGVAMSVAVIAFYEVLCFALLLPEEEDPAARVLTIVGYCLLAALPQWLGMLSVGNLFHFSLHSANAAAIATACVILVPQMLLNLLQAFTVFDDSLYTVFQTLESWTPQAMVDGAAAVVGDWSYVALSWVLGLFWVAVSSAIGMAVFHKKEIN